MEINKTLMMERLKKLRQEKGFSQMEASDYVGAGTGTWQQWEIGQRVPRDIAIIAIAAKYNVNIGYICGTTDQRLPDLVTIPRNQLEEGDWEAIQQYLQLTLEEKIFIRQVLEFIKQHR